MSWDLEDLAEQFDREGYVHLPDFFDAELMLKVARSCLGHFGSDPDWEHNDEFIGKSKAEIVPWFPQRDGDVPTKALFDEVDAYPQFAEITEALIGARWQNLYSMAMFSKQGTVGQAWHQDCPPENNKTYNLNRLIYPVAIDPAIGGEVALVPGSHKLGEVPVGEPNGDLDGQLVLRPGKGDLLLLHGHCWHKVLPVHGGDRFSLNHRAAPEETPATLTDVCVYRNMRYRFSTSEVVEERMAV